MAKRYVQHGGMWIPVAAKPKPKKTYVQHGGMWIPKKAKPVQTAPKVNRNPVPHSPPTRHAPVPQPERPAWMPAGYGRSTGIYDRKRQERAPHDVRTARIQSIRA